MKTNVLHDRATLASCFLIWVDTGLSWNSGVLMKTCEGISFSIAHLSPLKQLRCKYGQELLRFVDDKPPKRTNLPIVSVASSPLKAWTAKAKMQLWWSRVIYSWSWLVLRSDKDSLWNHHLTSFTRFFRRGIFKSFLLINRYFSFLRYSYVLSIWKLTCLVCCLRHFDWRDIHWSGVHDLFFQLDKSSLSPKMHANAQPFNYIKSLLVKRKF